MKTKNMTEFSRQQVRSLGLAATTQAGIEQARQMLTEWQQTHPAEPKLIDVFEQLYLMEDAWRSVAAEPASRVA